MGRQCQPPELGREAAGNPWGTQAKWFLQEEGFIAGTKRQFVGPLPGSGSVRCTVMYGYSDMALLCITMPYTSDSSSSTTHAQCYVPKCA